MWYFYIRWESCCLHYLTMDIESISSHAPDAFRHRRICYSVILFGGVTKNKAKRNRKIKQNTT